MIKFLIFCWNFFLLLFYPVSDVYAYHTILIFKELNKVVLKYSVKYS